MATTQSLGPRTASDQQTPWYVIGGLGVLVVAAYWNMLTMVASRWGTEDQYSHGYLVPIFAAVLIAMRREPFEEVDRSVRWWGVAIVTGGLLFRVVAGYFHSVTLDAVSLLPTLAGIFVIAGGWSALRWAGPPIAFLIFMYPLPTRP